MKLSLILSLFLFMMVPRAYGFEGNAVDRVQLMSCSKANAGSCRFKIMPLLMEVNPDHMFKEVMLFYGGALAFSGSLTKIEENIDQDVEIVLEGDWWLKESVVEHLMATGGLLFFESKASRGQTKKPKKPKVDPEVDDSDSESAEKPPEKKGASDDGHPLELANEFGEPYVSILARAGSAYAPTSAQGIGLELNLNRFNPVELGFGNYRSRANIIGTAPSKELQTVSLGTGLLLGKKGSQLSMGIALLRTQFESKLRDRTIHNNHYWGLFPKIGIRLTSDSYYLFTIDVGQYYPLGRSLRSATGSLSTSSMLFDESKAELVFGLGFGV